MDGIEWKRDKWSKAIKWLTKKMEKIAIKNSDYLISDNVGIQKYYKDFHKTDSFFSHMVQMFLNKFSLQF